MVLLNNRGIGRKGEDSACEYLKSSGYEIIERNFQKRCGEIDIIALKNDILVFVEVKNWPHEDFFSLSKAVGLAKQKRIIETSKIFLDTYRQYNGNYLIRFDVICINMLSNGKIYHIENAFSESV